VGGGARWQDHAVEQGPDLLDPPPRQGPEPGDPARDAQALSQSLELLLGGARADDNDAPATDELDAGPEYEVQPLIRKEAAEEVRPGRPGRELWAGRDTPTWGITLSVSDGCWRATSFAASSFTAMRPLALRSTLERRSRPMAPGELRRLS
jgi:hypothetical protein